MLFNSPIFLFLFLPAAMAGFFLFGRWGRDWAVGFLVAMSLFFYGWWNPIYLVLLGFSMAFNFMVGGVLARAAGARSGSPQAPKDRRLAGPWGVLLAGVAVNIGLIGYFKYWNFFTDSVNAAFDLGWNFETIILPLAISFFTFQQITFLVDSYRGVVGRVRLLDYALFVTFFPQLIAGPIVHHSEMMPQFRKAGTFRFAHRNLAIGLTIFIIGLFKKVVLADGIAVYATPVFNGALGGQELTFVEAWGGALAYAMQLYFDFSGYSDMAIGLARMFGVRLPLNFNSPYKAASIIDFWRRWHMTLSRFLRDYVYISLGGNKGGPILRYRNLMATMLLGGLWHGAGWTFVAWGGLHGLYLVVNNLWRNLGWRPKRGSFWRWPVHGFFVALTFLCVVVAWVPFRAESFSASALILEGMIGLNGIALPPGYAAYAGPLAPVLQSLGVSFDLSGTLFQGVGQIIALVFLLGVVWFLPNSHQVMAAYRPVYEAHKATRRSRFRWRPGPISALALAVMASLSLLSLTRVSEFLYFQF
ncbi:MAG: MBOAT family O-acyltransferase [Magnetospiraceae bacterium]